MSIRVVILAAGQGKRMGGNIPKPLIEIDGKPMVVHLAEAVIASGIDTRPVVVVAPTTHALFAQTFGVADAAPSGPVSPPAVTLAVQESPRGTGDALKAARDACAGIDGVMVLYGDHPFLPQETIRELAEASVVHAGAIVMLTARVPHFSGDYANFVSWAKVLRNDLGDVVAIREKKDATPEEQLVTEVNPGMYVFPAPWVWQALERISDNNASGEFYLTDLVKIALAEQVPIVTKTVDALQVMGVNTPDELARLDRLRHSS